MGCKRLMVGTKLMENNTFLQRNKTYLLVGFGFVLLTIWYLTWASVGDVPYMLKFIGQILQGDISGQLVPFETLSHYEQSEVALFGPNYKAIAPEIITGYEQRSIWLPYVFLVEFIAFLIAFKLMGGRKSVPIAHADDSIEIYSVFQRIVLWLNIAIVAYLFITGFSITFGAHIGGGVIHRYMRMTHELAGVVWIPVWFVLTIIAFKDHKYFVRPSKKYFYKFFLRGSYEPMERVNYLAYAAVGFVLCFSGFAMWYMTPDFNTYAQTIQFKRLLLFAHFVASAVISFFVFETVYSAVVSVKGYLPGLITGKLPKEYIKGLRKDLIDELK